MIYVVAIYRDGALRQQYLSAVSETEALAEGLLRFMRNEEGDMAAEYTLFAVGLGRGRDTSLPSWEVLCKAARRAGYLFSVTQTSAPAHG